ncbi:hypothetical protein IEQ34_013119 [Dendrobium chrysotoxum]|uniref:Uncharacterized protein n=1 Tax=Dendrobium chrysotoxum TaxID=161865 RepID=A0AAV7GQS6_DENCH|nr:hypothetical protein IEQ34_013119 [Dendrobium chrysotoxum]
MGEPKEIEGKEKSVEVVNVEVILEVAIHASSKMDFIGRKLIMCQLRKILLIVAYSCASIWKSLSSINLSTRLNIKIEKIK